MVSQCSTARHELSWTLHLPYRPFTSRTAHLPPARRTWPAEGGRRSQPPQLVPPFPSPLLGIPCPVPLPKLPEKPLKAHTRTHLGDSPQVAAHKAPGLPGAAADAHVTSAVTVRGTVPCVAGARDAQVVSAVRRRVAAVPRRQLPRRRQVAGSA